MMVTKPSRPNVRESETEVVRPSHHCGRESRLVLVHPPFAGLVAALLEAGSGGTADSSGSVGDSVTAGYVRHDQTKDEGARKRVNSRENVLHLVAKRH